MRLWLLVLLLAGSGAWPGALRAEDWPTPAHDASRSGRTADVAPPPYRVRWAKAWQYENIATVSQLIVAEGRGFIGTLGRDGSLAGKVHCVDVEDGRDLWTYDALAGGIAHSLTWSPAEGGTVYAATTAGEVVALEAATGKLRWKFATPLGGFVVNPCVSDGAVLLGSRQGVFYALEEANGAVRWQRDVKRPICHTAAAADGVVYFLDEAMRAQALQIADGHWAKKWFPRRLYGGSARFYWPVVTQDHVLLTVAPPHAYNWQETDAVLFELPLVSDRKQGDRFAVGAPRQEAEEQRRVIDFLKEHPHDQVLHCLSRASGRPSCTPGVLYTGGSGSECTPPVLTKDGSIVVEYRSWYSLWDSDSWVNPYSALGTLDPATGVVTQLRPLLEKGRVPWGHIWIIADESAALSVAGDTLLVAHQGNFGGVVLGSGKTFAGIGKRDTWGGYPPLSWNRQEWHGGPRSPLTIVDGTIYYVVGGRVIACEGAARPDAKSAEPVVVPSPEKVALPKTEPSDRFPDVADIDRIFREVAQRKRDIDPAATKAMRAALAKHVAELLEFAPHGDLHEWRGISPSARTMQATDEIIYALCLALPHLESEERAAALERIKQLAESFGRPPPTDRQPKLVEPRNYHRVDPADYDAWRSRQLLAAPRQGFGTLHAIYVATEAKDEHQARPRPFAARKSFSDDLSKTPVRDANQLEDPLERIQRVAAYSSELTHIAGRARIAERFQKPNEIEICYQAFHDVMKPYLTHYRQLGRQCAEHIDAVPGNDAHPSAGGQFRNLGGPYVGETHMAAIAFWTDLCPEAGAVLKEYAPDETTAIRAWMLRNAQGFYLARWDTPVQEGEVACPWYLTTQNYFHYFSTVDRADAATHKLLVDRPVGVADVYYIERLVRAIEAHAKPPER